jgi:signal transduction histidine kinase
MSIVQKIVNQHKGDIVVEDNPEGHGTIVSIRLPLEGTLDHAEYNINN